jgi:hypothetical protein
MARRSVPALILGPTFSQRLSDFSLYGAGLTNSSA